MVNIISIFAFMEEVYIPNTEFLSAAEIFRFQIQSQHCVFKSGSYAHIAATALRTQ